MAGEAWTQAEIDFLKEYGPNITCPEIAKKIGRTTRSVRHKFNELGIERRRAKVGDIVNDWKIVEIFSQHNGQQYVSMAKLESVVSDKTRTTRLSHLTNNHIGYPVNTRPDNTERNTTHGMSRSRLMSIWGAMITRCNNAKSLSYKDYGERGISVCEDWMTFESFKDWAMSHGYEEHLTLDREKVDGNYCPENCKWSTKIEQTINRRRSKHAYLTAFGETKHVIAWSHDPRCKISLQALRYRINVNWDTPENILTSPSERNSKMNLKNWLKQSHPEIYQEYVRFV